MCDRFNVKSPRTTSLLPFVVWNRTNNSPPQKKKIDGAASATLIMSPFFSLLLRFLLKWLRQKPIKARAVGKESEYIGDGRQKSRRDVEAKRDKQGIV